MTACGFFDFGFKSLEVAEHFTLLLHRIDPGVYSVRTSTRKLVVLHIRCSVTMLLHIPRIDGYCVVVRTPPQARQ